MIVVALRANSRIRGLISLDSATNTSGSCSATSSRSRRSCAGLRKDHSRETAIARIPSSSSDRIAARAWSSSSATMTVPSRSTRSVTSRACRLGSSAWSLAWPRTFCSSCGDRPRYRPSTFMMKIESRWPLVVRNPTGGTLPVTSAFSDDVVPWAMWWVRLSMSGSERPSCPASSSSTSRTPRE